jgi:CubicO group peptidase (beta-lactamase class C family)
MTGRALVLLWIALLLGHGAGFAETVREHPDQRLAANVADVVAIINNGDPTKLERFVSERYGVEMLQGTSVRDSAQFLRGVHEGKGPLELCCYHLSERIPKDMAVALLHESTADTWSSLQLRFDADDKITSLMIVPTKPPAGFAELAMLDEAGLARELDAYLSTLSAKDEFSGVVLVARDGEPLFTKAYGMANREHQVPNRTETRFRLGSMNKMFTAVAVAQLAEKGLLSFEDPIGKHLPPGWVDATIGKKVRIRHLLNHTSGLGDYLEPVLESAIYKFETLEDYKEIVVNEKLAFEPGTQWAYCNTGFLLLGVIVANVSGMDYFDYVRQHIYRPAGMVHSDHYDHTVPNPWLAEGYWVHEGTRRKNTLLLAPRGTSAGGGYSTVNDLLAFDVALRSNKLLGPEIRDRLFASDPERNSPSYGYGFMISGLDPDRAVGHGGSFPGVSAYLTMYLDSGFTFVALCNDDGAGRASTKVLSLLERLKEH